MDLIVRTGNSDCRRRASLVTVTLVLLLIVPVLAGPSGGGLPSDQGRLAGEYPQVIPSDFRGHRPILEFFTGLSCPSCMGGPHPDTEEMYEGIQEDEAVPWTYVVFHELNGGGEDGLANDESRARMRYYQPGVSGTPAIEVDGGWHTLGGIYGVDTISKSNTQAALDDAADRYDPSFDPRHPLDFVRNDFKFVNLEVSQHLEGRDWVVMVTVSYLGMDRLLLEEDLQGSLYIFMVEDEVTAWSAVEEANVLNHNVFRGYALEGMEFTMSPGDEQTFAGVWPIPEIEVDPNEEYPEGTPVPIKSMDVTAIAAVYDTGDTNSGDGIYGNPNPVPRCIQSATPRSTAYDLNNEAEPVGDVTITEDGTTLTFDAQLDDADGIASAAIHFSTEGPDSVIWTPVALDVTGEEVCDDEGVCYAYSDATATAEYELDEPVDEIWYVVTYSDGLGAMGRSDVLYSEVNAAAAAGDIELSLGGGTFVIIVMVLILVALGVLLYTKREDRAQRQAIAAVMVLVLIIGGVFAISAGGGGGTEAPDIAFTDLEGRDDSLSDLQGKVVVLDMMATWCPSCREGMADLVEVHERYGDSIEMITVDIDLTETPAQLRDYKKEFGAEWRFAMDNEDQDFLQEFDVKTIPKIVVIDINGDVVFSKSVVISADDLSDIIDEAQTGGAAAISISSAGGSMGALVLWAGALGVLTFFSPCSFPMLPGYMTYYLGLRESRNQRKALMGGVAAAAGIVLLFLVVAILVGIFGSAISQYVVYLEPVLGAMLVIMALLIILDININFGLLTFPIKKGMALSKRTMDRFRGKQEVEGAKVVKDIEEGGYVGLFLYGVGYGAAAAGCMAPIVIALILLAASQGSFLASVGIFLVFSVAMALLMVVITVALGHYGDAALKKLRVNPKTVKVLSSLVLLVVGVYLIAFYVGGVA